MDASEIDIAFQTNPTILATYAVLRRLSDNPSGMTTSDLIDGLGFSASSIEGMALGGIVEAKGSRWFITVDGVAALAKQFA